MSRDNTLEVNLAAINRRMRDNEGGLYLLVKITGVKSDAADLLVDIEVARDAANAALMREGQEVVWAGDVTPTPKGPVLDMDWIGSADDNRAWLDLFATTLAAEGHAGTITAAPEAHYPEAAADYLENAAPTTHLAFTLTDPDPYGYPPMTWLVDETTTHTLAEHAAAWVQLDRATTYFSEDAFQIIADGLDLADVFEVMAHRSAFGDLSTLTTRPFASRMVALAGPGHLSYNAWSEDARWDTYVPDIIAALRAHASRLDYGFVCCSITYTYPFSWSGTQPKPPGVTSSNLQYNPHVYAHYVPDAHAIQVLTPSHLDKAHDLSAWDIEELATDRFLVQSRDLAPWFGGEPTRDSRGYPLPDPEVLAAARRDFGAMILTLEDLEHDPQAWLPGQPHRPLTKPKPIWDPRHRKT